MCIDDFLPEDRRRRYDIIHGCVQTSLPFHTLRMYQHFGGQIPDVHFICKVPETLADNMSSASNAVGTLQGLAEVIKVHEEVKRLSRPKAHVQMARALEKRWSVVTDLSAPIARGILRDIAGYDIVGYTYQGSGRKKRKQLVGSETNVVDTRLSALLDTQDPSIILDGRGSSWDSRDPLDVSRFDAFWAAVERVIVSQDAAVVDDRRHNESASDEAGSSIVLQRSSNVSFRDIHERAARLLKEGEAVPSIRWMEYQFWPKDPTLRSAVNYTGRFKVSMAAQSAQLRKSHPDQMIGHVEFKYLKSLAVRKRLVTDMLCGDDKHKVSSHAALKLVDSMNTVASSLLQVNVGEMGFPVGAAVKTRRVIVGESEILCKADHDFSKFNLIPSVNLVVQIPERVEDSFYAGDTTVTIKCAITQPSSACRHVAEAAFALPQPSERWPPS